MGSPYTLYPDLAAEAPLPPRGILSQTLSDEDGIEFILFAFAAGEQLSEHTSARPAIIHVLSGEGDLTADDERCAAVPGTWLRMAANVRHSLFARTPMVMALYMLPAASKG
jgi:quercetin dioxygenase-like cupin family protein